MRFKIIKGGPGSGNWGHAGRPGLVGGSAPTKSGKIGHLASGEVIGAAMSIRSGPTASKRATYARNSGTTGVKAPKAPKAERKPKTPKVETQEFDEKTFYDRLGYKPRTDIRIAGRRATESMCKWFFESEVARASDERIREAFGQEMVDIVHKYRIAKGNSNYTAMNDISNEAKLVILNKMNDRWDDIAAGPIRVRSTIQGSEGIIDSGRFKSQFETGTSRGTFNPDYRAEAEDNGMGVPRGIDATKRPIYGIVHGDASNYGSVEFIIKEDVRQRTTITFGDSLGGFADRKTTAAPLPRGSDKTSSYSYGYGYEPSWKLFTTPANELDSSSYAEVQIHGGLKLSDVASVVIHTGYKTRSSQEHLETQLTALGIPVTWSSSD